MLHWHRWGRWETYDAPYVMNFPLNARRKFTRPAQRRVCDKCGMEKHRFIFTEEY